MKTKTRSVLLKTTSGTDVQHTGDVLSITGLNPGIRYTEVMSFNQVKSRAEVLQVKRLTIVGTTAPTANTLYKIVISSPLRKGEGWTGFKREYSYKTPAILLNIGATAALQNEFIVTSIVAKINADSSNMVIAATVGSGNGFTITDDAGYYPARSNGGSGGRLGAPNVYTVTNADGSGWPTSVMSTTTAAVYAYGVGTRMSQDMPVLHAYSGNIIAGEIDAPTATDGTFAVAGQLYDSFVITSLCIQDNHSVTDQLAHAMQTDIVFYDNGKGSVTTNLANSIIFEREMLKKMFETYKNNNNTVIEWFDKSIVVSGPIGAAPVGTTATNNSIAVYNDMVSPYSALELRNVGTQTILGPTRATNGLLIDQDINTGDGAHYSPSLSALNNQQFVVGKTDFSVVARFVMTAVTGANFMVGFHEKLYFTDFNDYVTLASVGTLSTTGEITTRGILANAATVITSSATLAVNAVVSEYIVKVDINGVVTCLVDGVVYPIYSVGTTPLVLAAGTVVVPFFQSTQITGTASVGVISEFVAVPTASWRL